MNKDLFNLTVATSRQIELGTYVPKLERRLLKSSDRPAPEGWDSSALARAQERHSNQMHILGRLLKEWF